MSTYIGGWYRVISVTRNGNIFDKIFPTEQEARDFGNAQWKLPFVKKIYISKMAYRNKKRHSIHIAEAEKSM